MTKAREQLQRILDGLKMEAVRNRGRLKRLETEGLHKRRGFLRRVHQGEVATAFESFNRAVEVLGVDVERFYGLHFAFSPDPVLLLEKLEREEPGEKLPSALLGALEHLLSCEPREPQQEGEPAKEPAESVADLTARPFSHQLAFVEALPGYRHSAFLEPFLEHLDALRYRDAGDAATLACAVATQLAAPQASKPQSWQALYCRALGVLASACRQLGGLGAANRTLRAAIGYARCWQIKTEEAALTQRACYVLTDYGEPQFALELAKHACALQCRVPKVLGIAKAFVDEGLLLVRLGRTSEATELLEEALLWLPLTEVRNRAAVFFALSRCRQAEADLQAASKTLERFAVLTDPVETINVVHLHLLRGEISIQQGDLDQAKTHFLEVKKLAKNLNPCDAALVSLDFLKVLLVRGEFDEVRALASELAMLLKSLRRNKLAHAALWAVTQAAALGELTEAAVAEARLQIASANRPGAPRRQR